MQLRAAWKIEGTKTALNERRLRDAWTRIVGPMMQRGREYGGGERKGGDTPWLIHRVPRGLVLHRSLATSTSGKREG